MKKITFCLLTLGALLQGFALHAQYVGKPPAHVVLVMEENYGYSKIIGSAYAPTFTALSKDSFCANFTDMYAITHPSEPNYLELFSGSNQGVLLDENGPNASAPFKTCNLAASLIHAGYTFAGYSETQPSVGWYNSDAGNYVTKHCPWINWVGGSADSVPVKDMLPFAPIGTYFPDSNHYTNLPSMSWVIPNLVDDMHDPSTASTAIPNGDTWFKKNLMPLVRWAAVPANNTVVIVVWDEDDQCTGCTNNIPLLICSGIVKGGNVTSPKVNHYSLLKLMEEMFGITTFCGSSSTATEIPSSIWTVTTGVNTVTEPVNQVVTWPIPAKNELNMHIISVDEGKATVSLYDITGRIVKEMPAELKSGDNYLTISTENVSNGIYFLNITGDKINVCKKIVIGK